MRRHPALPAAVTSRWTNCARYRPAPGAGGWPARQRLPLRVIVAQRLQIRRQMRGLGNRGRHQQDLTSHTPPAPRDPRQVRTHPHDRAHRRRSACCCRRISRTVRGAANGARAHGDRTLDGRGRMRLHQPQHRPIPSGLRVCFEAARCHTGASRQSRRTARWRSATPARAAPRTFEPLQNARVCCATTSAPTATATRS